MQTTFLTVTAPYRPRVTGIVLVRIQLLVQTRSDSDDRVVDRRVVGLARLRGWERLEISNRGLASRG